LYRGRRLPYTAIQLNAAEANSFLEEAVTTTAACNKKDEDDYPCAVVASTATASAKEAV